MENLSTVILDTEEKDRLNNVKSGDVRNLCSEGHAKTKYKKEKTKKTKMKNLFSAGHASPAVVLSPTNSDHSKEYTLQVPNYSL